MMLASRRTSPAMFGRPPSPTVWSRAFSSTRRVPASTASTADPPSRRTAMASRMPTAPLAVLTTITVARHPVAAGGIRIRIDNAGYV